MASLDPNIILGIRPSEPADPLTQAGKVLGIKGALQQQDLQSVQLQEAQRQFESGTKIRALLQANPNATPEQVMAIDPEKGIAFRKSALENAKNQAELEKTKQEILGKAIAQHRDDLANVNTPDDFAHWLSAGYQDPILGPILSKQQPLGDALAKIPTDPVAFQDMKNKQALGATAYIKANAPHYSTQDTGATSQIVATPGLGGKPQVVSTTPKTATPGEILTDKRQRELYGSFTGKPADLLASLAEKGVSIPAGMRSRAQISATLQGLIDRNPDKSPDQIADLVKNGQIGFGAEKKETQTAAGIAGRVGVAGEEITQFAPLVEEASKNVPRGKFVPIGKLMQTAEASISDPNLKQLKIQINSLMNAYDQLAARGGTDKDKRAEAHSLLTSAESHEALMAGLKAFQKEVTAAQNAANIASLPRDQRDAARKALTGAPVTPAADAKPAGQSFDSLPDPAKFSGKVMTDTTTKQKYKSDGSKWVRQ